MTATIDETVATAWIERWDAQQELYMPDREDRFAALIDAVEEACGRPDPLVVDLGCGPGSLSTRLLARLPEANVVAVDADPLLLGLGRAVVGASQPAPRFVEADLAQEGWSKALGLDRPVDAAVSTTALHWLAPARLAVMYAELATIIRPGGLLLNGDHLAEDKSTAPVLAKLGWALIEREDARRRSGDRPEDWSAWWAAATADPLLADLVAERASKHFESDHHGSPSGLLTTHVDALRAAGFAEVGTLWQRGENRLLCAVR
jgi:SAM-dependent methyltransferase